MSDFCIVDRLQELSYEAETMAEEAKTAIECGEAHEIATESCKDNFDLIVRSISDWTSEAQWLDTEGLCGSQTARDRYRTAVKQLLDGIIEACEDGLVDVSDLPVIAGPF